MDACLLPIGDRLFAPDANGIFLRFDLQIVFLDTWQFDDRNEVVVLLEYIDRRKTADRSGSTSHPVACDACVECALQSQQRFKWVTKASEHLFLH
jgi:hypothetical protein